MIISQRALLAFGLGIPCVILLFLLFFSLSLFSLPLRLEPSLRDVQTSHRATRRWAKNSGNSARRRFFVRKQLLLSYLLTSRTHTRALSRVTTVQFVGVCWRTRGRPIQDAAMHASVALASGTLDVQSGCTNLWSLSLQWAIAHDLVHAKMESYQGATGS
jgi:hypothetical protein